MLEKCVYCDNPISAYPCKYCGYRLSIPDVCPRFQNGRCVTTNKLCPNKSGYMNCKVLDKD